MKAKVISIESYMNKFKAKVDAVERAKKDILKRIESATIEQSSDITFKSKGP